jgi:hypothetical protein
MNEKEFDTDNKVKEHNRKISIYYFGSEKKDIGTGQGKQNKTKKHQTTEFT